MVDAHGGKFWATANEPSGAISFHPTICRSYDRSVGVTDALVWSRRSPKVRSFRQYKLEHLIVSDRFGGNFSGCPHQR